ncbi:MAG: phytanoyl-CoA dioxygenase family protein [Gammaproteobacteria bacterium]
MGQRFVTTFEQRGYLVVPDLLSPVEIAELRDEIARICSYHAVELGVPTEMIGPDLIGRILCVHQPHKLSDTLVDCARHPRLVEVLSGIVGPDVKCMQSQAFVKPPGFPGNAWHQDECAIPTRDQSLVAAWIALDDSTEANGCLRVVPGTHRSGYLFPQQPHGRPEEYDFPTQCFGFDETAQLALEVTAGSVVFFHGYLVHGSRANRSNNYRRALTYHYMNAYSLLPWRIPVAPGQSEVRGAMADDRDVFLVCGSDPYAWKGYTDIVAPHLRLCHHPNAVAVYRQE